MTQRKIYGSGRTRAFRVLWAAAEIGLEYEHISISGADGATRTPEYLATNPMGKVPFLIDGDVRLSESIAINLYLARRYGGALFPAGWQGEASVYQWSLFGAAEVDITAVQYGMNKYLRAPELCDATAAAAAWAELSWRFDHLEKQLCNSPFILGDVLTIADINVAGTTYTAWTNSTDFSAWPAMEAWLRRCYSRPAAIVARHLREGDTLQRQD